MNDMNPVSMFPGEQPAISSAGDGQENVIVSGPIRVIYHRDFTTRIVLADCSEIIVRDPLNHIVRYWPQDDCGERVRLSQDPEKFLRRAP